MNRGAARDGKRELSHKVKRPDGYPADPGQGSAIAGSAGIRIREAVGFTFSACGWQELDNSGERHAGQHLLDSDEGQDLTTANRGARRRTTAQHRHDSGVTVQTSNFAADTVQGVGYFNYTMKSGTNQLHGALTTIRERSFQRQYALVEHETRARRNDYGFSLGGPVSSPNLQRTTTRHFSLQL